MIIYIAFFLDIALCEYTIVVQFGKLPIDISKSLLALFRFPFAIYYWYHNEKELRHKV